MSCEYYTNILFLFIYTRLYAKNVPYCFLSHQTEYLNMKLQLTLECSARCFVEWQNVLLHYVQCRLAQPDGT